MLKKPHMIEHCRILRWIEEQDPDFAAAIQDLCLEGLLTINSSITGITFLYPTDSKHRSDFIELVYSNPDKAVSMFESFIMQLYLPTSRDFRSKSVGNKLGVKFEIESATDTTVRIANGFELTLSEFKPRKDRNLAVWLVTMGCPPISGAPYSPPRPAMKIKKGGNELKMVGHTKRVQLAVSTEHEFDIQMKKDKCCSYNPYLAKVISFLNYLKLNNTKLLESIAPILDYDPVVSFYLVFEPYKTKGTFLIPDDELFEEGGWCCVTNFTDAVKEYECMFTDMTKSTTLTAVDETKNVVTPFSVKNADAVFKMVDKARKHYGSLNARLGPKEIQSMYETFATKNSIGGMGPILADDTKDMITGPKKIWQDELRFLIFAALEEVRNGIYTSEGFNAIVQELRMKPGNDYVSEVRLSNCKDLKLNVSPRIELLLLLKFVNSSDFLYIPVSPDKVGESLGDMDPDNWVVFNRNSRALARLRCTTGMIHVNGISAQSYQEIANYVKRNGHLPSTLLDLAL